MNQNDISDNKKENFENQIMQDKSENIKIDSQNDSYPNIEYPSKRITKEKPKKEPRNIATLIISVIVIFLIISTFFFSWYCISIGMSMFFFFPISVDADMNFHLTEINIESSSMMNDSESVSVSYSEMEEDIKEEDKEEVGNLISLFRNMSIFVIVLLIFSIIAFIGILCTTFNFGNKKTMKKIGISFGILTFIIGIFTAGYFIYAWDSDVIQNGLPNSEDDSETVTINLFDTEEGEEKLNNIGFWDSKSISMNFPDSNESNTSFITFEGDSDIDLFSFDFSFKPGLAWHIILLVSILSLLSTIILLNKKLLPLILILIVCSIVLFGFLFYMSINVEAEDSSSMFSWDDTSDPAEVAKFLGTWSLDVDKTVGHNTYSNITKETWVFWENETLNNYRVSTQYEGGGNGSTTCPWSVTNNNLSLCGGKYSYVFSNDEKSVTLTKNEEIIVLDKID